MRRFLDFNYPDVCYLSLSLLSSSSEFRLHTANTSSNSQSVVTNPKLLSEEEEEKTFWRRELFAAEIELLTTYCTVVCDMCDVFKSMTMRRKILIKKIW